jgi:hypothetical protein
MFPVTVLLDRGDLEAVGLERLRRGYTANARIITRSERLIDLIWEYLLRRTERKQEAPAQAAAEKSPSRTALPDRVWSVFLPARDGNDDSKTRSGPRSG